ncbi:hypothetical protein Tco_0836454 [Tanacetum coccineum]
MGLWYSKDSCIALTAFADADHAGFQDTRRSTSGNILTKALGRERLEFLINKLGMRSISSETLKSLNQEAICQVIARDEKWVPTKDRVKISTTNVRLETNVPQKEETFQVIIDVIKNSTCYKAFTISAEILDICSRVQGVDFAEVLDDETTLTFLIDLGYKGPLYKHPSMYVDHMHQPWRTMAAVIKKCLSGKSASNDRLWKSRIDIL